MTGTGLGSLHYQRIVRHFVSCDQIPGRIIQGIRSVGVDGLWDDTAVAVGGTEVPAMGMEDLDPQPADTTVNTTRNHNPTRVGAPLTLVVIGDCGGDFRMY